MGLDVLALHIAYGTARASDEERTAALKCYAQRLRMIEGETPIVSVVLKHWERF